jgi:hypothetical protein
MAIASAPAIAMVFHRFMSSSSGLVMLSTHPTPGGQRSFTQADEQEARHRLSQAKSLACALSPEARLAHFVT